MAIFRGKINPIRNCWFTGLKALLTANYLPAFPFIALLKHPDSLFIIDITQTGLYDASLIITDASGRAERRDQEAMKKVRFKFGLDIFILVITLILMDPRAYLGMWFHEWAGLLIALFYILHKILNWNWIKGITKRLFGRVSGRTRLNYILDVLLLLSFTFIIWSGMGMSRTIDFSFLGFDRGRNMIYMPLHVGLSMLVIIIIGIHIGLHWNWVVARFKRSK